MFRHCQKLNGCLIKSFLLVILIGSRHYVRIEQVLLPNQFQIKMYVGSLFFLLQ